MLSSQRVVDILSIASIHSQQSLVNIVAIIIMIIIIIVVIVIVILILTVTIKIFIIVFIISIVNAYAQLPRSLPRSCASFYEKKICLRQFLRQLTRTLRTHAFWKFLTPMLTQRLRDPYARSVF